MQITHLGHSCVLIESGKAKVLVDPGNFSSAWHNVTGLDAIFVTHQHKDHFDQDKISALLAANPQAQIWLEPETKQKSGLSQANEMIAGTSVMVNDLQIDAVGGTHACIHKDIPSIGNVGLVFQAEGDLTLFHPGDCLAEIPKRIDIVCIPGYGPWAAMKETIDFVRAVGARYGFIIHDGLLNERGWKLVFDRMNEMTTTKVTDIRQKPHWNPLLPH